MEIVLFSNLPFECSIEFPCLEVRFGMFPHVCSLLSAFVRQRITSPKIVDNVKWRLYLRVWRLYFCVEIS
jgi:hypothetical protein